jgi:hypothetical protein
VHSGIHQQRTREYEDIMKHPIAIVSICLAAALSCASAFAGRDGGQINYQAQTLERIKQAGRVDARTEIRRIHIAYWDSRRSPQAW